ncbi:amidophosphoribosyltransferase [Porphyromonas sp.]|uniref:amidophosphoribosyltransferase n=1 Tax=Porphyromonas sp. TaxID=1924944 RepID=UPI0026DD63C7|nr:amidophosphoribosyltransferase [Porphyromonas sp.]MDO4695289.1 amidophosphoribosyltransferase [Porphyromonas sp.]MDO4770673.1 amidophosphoribosyltransferase [Porphyromonas sp.]
MEPLKHECGIAVVRLRKPLEYYHQRYGTWMYGINKMYLLMEKQHNRGQEGAGIACVKLAASPGEEYMHRERALGNTAITKIFNSIHSIFNSVSPEQLSDPVYATEHVPFAGECYLGHLRYSTTGKKGLEFVHPMMRRSNWRAKSLAVCGNFNLTSVDVIFDKISSVGQHPRNMSDTHILLEQIGHRLDREVEHRFRESKAKGLTGMDITNDIEARINMTTPLKECSPDWDGGYAMCGLTGSGEMYVMRDPWGIRPAFYYIDDEIIVVASERPVIQTVLNVTYDRVQELCPGQAITIDRTGQKVELTQILEPKQNKACSFERIYFSRGSDIDIYKERKQLGKNLVPQILKSINGDLDHAVFSFIPNTAEVAYFGMVEGLNEHLNKIKAERITSAKDLSKEEIEVILQSRIRAEKVAIKDIKLRTFIAEGTSRNDLAGHVYDVTYGSLKRGEDALVVIDDSIVRGTTLKESIISILDRLGPRKIVIVSSSPQVRYPDYYGIDMSKMKEFVAFRAAIALLMERGKQVIIHDTYARICKAMEEGNSRSENFVKAIYEPFTLEEINAKIVELLKPDFVKSEVELVYQTMEGLHDAIPNHPGDWYFSGDYPTPGGTHLVNRAYMDYYENDFKKI